MTKTYNSKLEAYRDLPKAKNVMAYNSHDIFLVEPAVLPPTARYGKFIIAAYSGKNGDFLGYYKGEDVQCE